MLAAIVTIIIIIQNLWGKIIIVVVVQSLSRVQLFVTPWTVALQGFPVLHCLPEFDQTHVH